MNNIQKAYERLHRKETDEIVDYAYELEQQLQAYKDKEDKMREILKYEYSDAILGRFGRDLKYGLLQIINEGSDK